MSGYSRIAAFRSRRCAGVDPEDFLRALPKISPDDAETVREKASEAMEREDRERVKDADDK
jgi:hypothetical protein